MAQINDFIKNFNNESEFNYSIHIADNFSFIYFANPKTACTAAKASINLTFARALGFNHDFDSIGDIHSRQKNPLKTPFEVGYTRFLSMLADPNVTKLCFSRDPFSRTASAYASKIGSNDSISNKIMKKFKIDHAFDLPSSVTFSDFSAALAEDPVFRDCDEHWRLQRKQTCADLVPDMIIGKQENANTDLRHILEGAFGKENVVLFDVVEKFPQNLSNSREIMAAATEKDIMNIRTAYAADYEWLSA